MKKHATESYLAGEVMTATPQKLQLMLLDAAIRNAERARRHWRDGEAEDACLRLIRAQEIVGEMIGSLDYESDSDLVRSVAGVYLFVFRSLLEANADRDEKKLDEALRVLAVERETWRQICETYPGTIAGTPVPSRADRPHAGAPAPAFESLGESTASGLSLEA